MTMLYGFLGKINKVSSQMADRAVDSSICFFGVLTYQIWLFKSSWHNIIHRCRHVGPWFEYRQLVLKTINFALDFPTWTIDLLLLFSQSPLARSRDTDRWRRYSFFHDVDFRWACYSSICGYQEHSKFESLFWYCRFYFLRKRVRHIIVDLLQEFMKFSWTHHMESL